jgi:isopenicillin N synthase-like dioxygenase
MPSTEHLSQRDGASDLEPGLVPDIDVAALFGSEPGARAAVSDAIRRACQEPGFFRIHGTCIAQPLIASVLAQMQRFFGLADDDPIKRAVHNRFTPGGNGWGPIGEEPAYQPGTTAHVESFDCGPRLSAYGPHEDPSAYGVHPSVWPELPGFHATVREYWDAAGRLGTALCDAFAEALGIERDFLAARCSERARRTLRLLHYPGRPQGGATPGLVGIAAHTDFECFTLMYQTAPGLELTDVRGRWFRVPGEPDRFTVIVGDMLERWTNGTLRATGHRVALTPWQRYSVILFFAADPEQVIAPLPQFCNANNPPRYDATTQVAHIERELARAYRNRGQPPPP